MPALTAVHEPAGWQRERACLDTDLYLWFGPADDQAAESTQEKLKRESVAKRYCRQCPFTRYCLELELALPAAHQHGVRGGLSSGERRALLRERRHADREVA